MTGSSRRWCCSRSSRGWRAWRSRRCQATRSRSPAAFGQALLYGLLMLAAGSLSFAVAPFVGRTRALAFGLIALFGGYLINSYASLSPVDRCAATGVLVRVDGRAPPAGRGVRLDLGRAAAPRVTAGSWRSASFAFERRDLGDSAALRWLRLPSLPAGIRGPFTRQLADRAGIAIAWGVGIGLYASLIIVSADAFAKSITSIPQIAALIKAVYPGIDIQQPSGILQLTFFGVRVVHHRVGRRQLRRRLVERRRTRWAAAMSSCRHRCQPLAGSLSSGLGVYGGHRRDDPRARARSWPGRHHDAGGRRRRAPWRRGHARARDGGVRGVGLAVGGVVRASLAAPSRGAAGHRHVPVGHARVPRSTCPTRCSTCRCTSISANRWPASSTRSGSLRATMLAVGGLVVGAWGLRRRDLDR